jgi:hypothetical protein
MISQHRTARRTTTGALVLAVATLGTGVLLAPGAGTASSHREAPLVAADPAVDSTDAYAFTSPDKPATVTLIHNVKPFQLPAGGPGFDPFPNQDDVRYNINVDANGDAKPDLTYRFSFTGGFKDTSTFLYNTGAVNSLEDPTLNFTQAYKVELVKPGGTTVLVEGAKAAPANVGKTSMPDYGKLRDEALATGKAKDGTLTFAGPADDPFFLDLRVFDLLYGGDLSEVGNSVLDGLNVSTLAVQVPKNVLAAAAGGDKSGVIGVWGTTERRSITVLPNGTRKPAGDFVQVSRIGNPLVNEVVSSVALKDAFNSLPPEKDATVKGLVDRVSDPEVPKLIEKIYKIPAPAAPRKDIVSVFLTGVKGLNQPAKVTPAEMIRLNMGTALSPTPNRLGVLAGDKGGFPNGRRLADDVVDIELQTLEGALQADGTVKLVDALAAGDAVDGNDLEFLTEFPYVALPHAGSNLGTGGTGGAKGTGTSGGTEGNSNTGRAGAESSSPSPGGETTGNVDADNASSDSDSGLSTGAWVFIAILVGLIGIAAGRLLGRGSSNDSSSAV